MSSSTSGPLRLAEEYLVRGDIKEALGIYQRISETEPSNLTIKSRLGELCVLANQNSHAVKILTDVARAYIREGHTTEAVTVLRRVLKIGSPDPDTLMDVAGLCGRAGLVTEAERCYLQAADMYAGAGEPNKLEAAYELAAAVAPANAEVLMKFGAMCHRSGRMADSYRAFMKAAAEFKRRGDESSALDAYGKALKVAPSGAEAGNAVAEVMKHLGLSDSSGGAAGRTRSGERQAAPLQFPNPTGAIEHSAPLPRGDGARQSSKPEATDDELLVGKISKAELLFGFGRFDQAIALLKDLVELKPDDPRIYRKLKDIYLRSEMPDEAAEAYRELARIYKKEGDEELAADCAASARRLSGHTADPLSAPTAGSQSQPEVVWPPVGEAKEPDLTLITPALPFRPPAQRYAPARPAVQPDVTASGANQVAPAEAASAHSAQPPTIVVSGPPVPQVRISTPPLTPVATESEMAIESEPPDQVYADPTSGSVQHPEEQNGQGANGSGRVRPAESDRAALPAARQGAPTGPVVNPTPPPAAATRPLADAPAPSSTSGPVNSAPAAPVRTATPVPPAPQRTAVSQPSGPQTRSALNPPPTTAANPSGGLPARSAVNPPPGPARTSGNPSGPTRVTATPPPAGPSRTPASPRAFAPAAPSKSVGTSGATRTGSGPTAPPPARMVSPSPAAPAQQEIEPDTLAPELVPVESESSLDALESVEAALAQARSRSAAASATGTAPAKVKAAGSAGTLFGVELDESKETESKKPANRRTWIVAAATVVVLSGSAGGYLMVRRHQAKQISAPPPIEAQADPTPLESPAIAPIDVSVGGTEASADAPTTAETPDRQTDAAKEAKRAAELAAQKQQQQQQFNSQPAAIPTPHVAAVQPTQQPKPTPPPAVGSVSAVPGSTGGPSVAPGGFARDLPAAPPPPSPGPTAKRSAVMAGGEVTRRVEPNYPPAARSAHITGTVTVELSINEQGNVTSARATSGPGMLQGAAEAAARGFKFRPVTLDGVPVRSNRTVLFHFKE